MWICNLLRCIWFSIVYAVVEHKDFVKLFFNSHDFFLWLVQCWLSTGNKLLSQIKIRMSHIKCLRIFSTLDSFLHRCGNEVSMRLEKNVWNQKIKKCMKIGVCIFFLSMFSFFERFKDWTHQIMMHFKKVVNEQFLF